MDQRESSGRKVLATAMFLLMSFSVFTVFMPIAKAADSVPYDNIGIEWNRNPNLILSDGSWDVRISHWLPGVSNIYHGDNNNYVKWNQDGLVESRAQDGANDLYRDTFDLKKAVEFDQGHERIENKIFNLDERGGWSNKASSLMVQGSVTLYDGIGYTGESITFTSDVPNLDFYGWNDKASSLTLTKGSRVTLYENINYGGGSISFAYPSYQPPYLKVSDKSSITLEGVIKDPYTDINTSPGWTGVKFDLYASENPYDPSAKTLMLEMYFVRDGLNLAWPGVVNGNYWLRAPAPGDNGYNYLIALDTFPQYAQSTVYAGNVVRWKIDVKAFIQIACDFDWLIAPNLDINKLSIVKIGFSVEAAYGGNPFLNPAASCSLTRLRLAYTEAPVEPPRVDIFPKSYYGGPELNTFMITNHPTSIDAIGEMAVTFPPKDIIQAGDTDYQPTDYMRPIGWTVIYQPALRQATFRANSPWAVFGIMPGQRVNFTIYFSAGPTSEGRYYPWIVSTTDAAMNSHTVYKDQLIDRTPPFVKIDVPADGSIVNGTMVDVTSSYTWIYVTAYDHPLPGSPTGSEVATLTYTINGPTTISDAFNLATDGSGTSNQYKKQIWNLAEGDYTITATATDGAGNSNSITNHFSYQLDFTPPVTTNDYDGLWHTTDFTINLSATDQGSGVLEIFYRINDGPTQSSSLNGQPLITVETANNTLEYWSEDKVGNVEAHHLLKGIKLDKTCPTTVAYYDDLWHNTDFTIGIITKDELSGVSETYYKINGGPAKAVSTDGQPFISSEGANNTLEYWSVDNARNEELPHKTLTGIKLDKTAPVTFDDYDGVWHNADFAITLTADDNVGGVAAIYYRVNAGSIETANGTVQPRITFEGANNTLEYWSVDGAGNEETHHVVTGIKLDKMTPVGSIIINDGDVYTNSTSATLSLIANDSVSGVVEMRFSSDNISWTSWEMYNASNAWSLTLGDGTKTVYCQFMDNAGLASDVCTDSIVLDTTGPIVEAPARTPQGDVKPNQSVRVSVNVSDPLSGVRSVWLAYNTSGNLRSDFPMTLNTTTGLYEYTIPGQKANTLEKYRITANDLAGNSVTNINAERYYQYKTVSRFPRLLVVFLSLGAAMGITISILLAVIVYRRKRATAIEKRARYLKGARAL